MGCPGDASVPWNRASALKTIRRMAVTYARLWKVSLDAFLAAKSPHDLAGDSTVPDDFVTDPSSLEACAAKCFSNLHHKCAMRKLELKVTFDDLAGE